MATLAMPRQQSTSFFRKFTAGLSEFTKNLMGTTSLVSPQIAATKKIDNPFGNFGVLASAEKFKANAKPMAKSALLFSIEEAKNRLVELVENRFKADNLTDLVEYLGSKFLKLETWKLSPGPINMLIDTKSNQAVVAHAVHPSLSTTEVLKTQLRGELAREIGNTAPAAAFGSWEGLSMALANSRSNLGYMVSKGQAYMGKTYAPANDARSLHEIVAAAKKDGISLILPTTDGTINGQRIPGLPVLNKQRSVKAETLHSGLDHDTLKKAFGGAGLLETIDSKVAAKRSRDAQFAAGAEVAQVFDVSQFVQKTPEPFANSTEDRNVSSFGGFDDDVVADIHEEKRDLSIRLFAGVGYVVYDRNFNEETQIKFEDMPAGRYDRENEHGFVEGYTDINDFGGLTHYDRKGNVIERENKVEMDQTIDDEYEATLPKFGR